MEECTALTVYKPTFTPEDLEQIGNAAQHLGEALTRIRESFTKIAEALAEALKPAIEAATKWIGNFYEELLRSVATPKEWWLMHHAKKWRTRKKYRNRLIKRLTAALAERGDDDDAE